MHDASSAGSCRAILLALCLKIQHVSVLCADVSSGDVSGE